MNCEECLFPLTPTSVVKTQLKVDGHVTDFVCQNCGTAMRVTFQILAGPTKRDYDRNISIETIERVPKRR